MIVATAEAGSGKGWLVGPWNSRVPVAVGFSDVGVDEPHVHDTMFEIDLVARGTATVAVGPEEIKLHAGAVLIVEPGEPHTFRHASDGYLHVVVQAPFVAGDKHGPVAQ